MEYDAAHRDDVRPSFRISTARMRMRFKNAPAHNASEVSSRRRQRSQLRDLIFARLRESGFQNVRLLPHLATDLAQRALSERPPLEFAYVYAGRNRTLRYVLDASEHLIFGHEPTTFEQQHTSQELHGRVSTLALAAYTPGSEVFRAFLRKFTCGRFRLITQPLIARSAQEAYVAAGIKLSPSRKPLTYEMRDTHAGTVPLVAYCASPYGLRTVLASLFESVTARRGGTERATCACASDCGAAAPVGIDFSLLRRLG